MPYQTIAELPVNVKKAYSDKAQAAFMAAFNGVFAQTKDEARAFAAAHSAARKVDGIKEVEALDIETDHKFMGASFWFEGGFDEGVKKDEDSGVYKVPVTLIKPGLSKNKVYYSAGWLSKFAAMMEGGKAYINHEKKSEIKDRQSRSVDDVAGWYTGVHQAEDSSVKGILNLVETPRTKHAIGLAQANPELVGLSINARGKASRGKINGENAMIAETLERVNSTDIVPEPAAGGTMDMRFAAGVCLDIEAEEDMDDNKTPDNDNIKTWLEAEWLEAEKTYKEGEMDIAAAKWYQAEAVERAKKEVLETSSWLDAETKYKNELKSWLDAEMGEVTKVLPDNLKSVVEDMDLEHTKKFVETIRAIPPDKPILSGPAVEDKKQPGEEGFKRNFL